MVGGIVVRNFKKTFLGIFIVAFTLMLVACNDKSSTINTEKPADAPDTWIADRTITGLVFQSANDASVELNPEIQAYIKEKTGITLKLQGITSKDSQEALAAGLAAGDLPDFISYYLDNSGRPEMSMLLKASKEGMFTDLAPYLKDTKTYSKYFEKGYLPEDTAKNIMFRNDWDGASYLVHMSINRNVGDIGRKTVGGVYIKKAIVDALGIDPNEITTSEKLYDLALKIKNGKFVDDNGKPVTVIGPTVWGGMDRDSLYNDLVWTGTTGEKFMTDKSGKVLHETQTNYGIERVKYVQKLMQEGLMTKEFYTMEETRAKEGVVNGSFAMVSNMHNFITENNDLTYIPLGPIKRVDGTNDMVISYKSGYAGWAIPSTTEMPEHIVKFADWLASEEGKLLYFYGLEGRDYELDEKGKPVVKKELLTLLKENPEEAKKLGFRGVGSYWGEHLGYTDMDNVADFGELTWGESVAKEDDTAAQQIAKIYDFDKHLKEARIIDGLSVQSFLYEFEGDKGELTTAIDRYKDDVLRAYYAKDLTEAEAILAESKKNLESKGLSNFTKFIEDKIADGVTIKY
ncbi:extracellular solute-binding protein [Viridibacillus arvi]|uniref:extracellular solute-binding protein n=1 Tax=Viridibacillus arvi TaxID=263475 RepID=UPI003690882C